MPTGSLVSLEDTISRDGQLVKDNTMGGVITNLHLPRDWWIFGVESANSRVHFELENPLSSFSGVQWSRQDIFSRPQGLNPLTLNGQPILRVNLLNPQQTGFPQLLPEELSSVTLGSYQPGLVRSYVTNMR